MLKVSNGRVLRGKAQLSEYWQQRLGNASDIRITIENVEIHIIDENHVWTSADEHISIGDEYAKAIVTNIFILEDSRWKILLDHTTLLE